MQIGEIATGLQFPEGPIAMADGLIVLVEIARGTLSRVTPDGRIQVLAEMGGGPNGAAIGPDGAVYVCNNGGFNFHTEYDGCFRPVSQSDSYSGGRIEHVSLAVRADSILTCGQFSVGVNKPMPQWRHRSSGHGKGIVTVQCRRKCIPRKGRDLVLNGARASNPDGEVVFRE
jgi:hypothetical protein